MNAKLPAQPLQSVEAHLVEQPLGGSHALAQAPAHGVLELLQRDVPTAAFSTYELNQLICREWGFASTNSEELTGTGFQDLAEPARVSWGIFDGKAVVRDFDVPWGHIHLRSDFLNT